MNSVDNFLAHYGVKGMKWGKRKATITTARSNQGLKARNLIKAEQEYLKARESGDSKATAAKKKELDSSWKDQQKNRLTAATLTRGEQLVLGALYLPVLVGTTYYTRDSKKIKDYPMRALKNVESDDRMNSR